MIALTADKNPLLNKMNTKKLVCININKIFNNINNLLKYGIE